MKIRIINLDSYMGTPIANLDVFYSEFRGSAVNQVPIIRIYGSTEEGQKICLHIHGVFPYIYVPYDGSIPADGFLYQVASGLDKAINLSLGQASSNVQHIYKVSLVSGIPFYGYHSKQHQFLKLYFYNPLIVKKACSLLQNGSILGKIYQPHEAHIPYILQFMIDYNLHGMSFVDLADIKYRVDPKQQNEYPENSTLPLSVQKMSVCKLEGDVQADLILNRLEITPGHLTVNPGIKALWEDEKQRLRNNDELSLVEHCLTQNRIETPPTATHIAYKKILEEKLQMKSRNDDSSSESDLSVYPAETPPSLDLLDASMVEKHTSRSQETDDSLLDETIVENQNETTLNEDAKNLYDLLERMKEDNIEPDSILSQKHEECASDQEDIDLSLPLNATLTPKKIESNCDDSHDFLNDSYFNTLAKIPQLDGAFDEETEGEQILEQGKNYRQTSLLENSTFFAWCREKKGVAFKGVGKVTKTKRTKRNCLKIRVNSLIPKARKRSRTQCTNCGSDNRTHQLCIKKLFIKIENCDKTITKNGQIKIERTESKVVNDITFIQSMSSPIKTEDLDSLAQELISNNNEGGFPSKELNWFDVPSLCGENDDIMLHNNRTEVGSNNNEEEFPNKQLNLFDMPSLCGEDDDIVLHNNRTEVGSNNNEEGFPNKQLNWFDMPSLCGEDDDIMLHNNRTDVGSNGMIADAKLLQECTQQTDLTEEVNNNNINKSECNVKIAKKRGRKKKNHVEVVMGNAKNKAPSLTTTMDIERNTTKYNLRSNPKPTDFFTHEFITPNTNITSIKKNKSKRQNKNKKTQTKNTAKSKLSLKKLRQAKSNIILTRKEGTYHGYDVKFVPIEKKPVKYYDLGPNPKVKFRVVPAERPYSFQLKSNSTKYPNTTWENADEGCNSTQKVTQTQNSSIVIRSNRILNDNQRYDEMCLERGKIVDVIKPNFVKIEEEKSEISSMSCDVTTSDNEIKQEQWISNSVQMEQKQEVSREIDERIMNMANNPELPLLTPSQEEYLNSLLPSEFTNNGLNIPDIFQSIETSNENDGEEYTDCANDNQGESLTYPQEVKSQYQSIMDKMGRSLTDLFDSIRTITERNTVSGRKILESLRNDGIPRNKQEKVYKSEKQSVSATYKGIIQTGDRSVVLRGKKYRRQELKEITFETDLNNNGKHDQVINLNTSQADLKVLTFTADTPSHVSSTAEIVKSPLNILSKDPNTLLSNHSDKLNSLIPTAFVSISETEDVDSVAFSSFTFENRENTDGESIVSDVTDDTKISSLVANQRKHSLRKRRSKFNNERKINTNISSCSKLPRNDKIVKRPQTNQKLQFSKYIHNLESAVGLLVNPTKVAVNQHNDIDYRVRNYELFKGNLERSHETQHAAGDNVSIDGNVFCRICYVKMRRYNYANLNPVVPLRDRLEFNNKQFTSATNIRSASSLQRSHMVNYVADPNNNQNNFNFGLPYNVKANRRRTENSSALMNQRKYLDGTNDSSSEDENTTKPTPKKISKMSKSSPRSASRYSPLQVQHRASPKKASQTTFPKTNLQNQNPPMVSFTKQVLVQTTKDDSNLKSDHPQFRHKRKLSFSDATPLDRTKLEEGLVCSYKSKHPSKRPPLPADEPTQNPYISSKLNQQYLIPTNPKELAPSLLTPYQKVTSDTIDTNQSDESVDSIKFSDSSDVLSDDIFSPDLQEACGDPAESYDIQNKFIPLAGSSKLLPNPSDANRPTSALNNIQSSAETVCDATLSGKSFFTSDNSERSNAGNLTPYQKQNIEEKETIASEINAESSESEVTPYQRSFITEVKANLSVCEHFERIDSTESLGPVILVPKFNPPTRDFVISTLEEYNIPEVHHQEPFYSDVKDVTGAMEVGMKVLRIPSDKLADLPEFQSNFKGLNHYRRTTLEQLYPNEKLTNKEICNYKMSFCKNGDCVVTPARLPPSREDVELWLRNRLENKSISADKTAGRKKIFIPRSPGGGDDDSNDSMTISPCTPLDETIKNIEDSAERHPNHSSKLPELNITKDKNTDPCQITGVTLNNSDNFAISCNNLQEAKALNEYLHLTILCIELIVETRGDYKPNPAHDSVRAIVFKIFNDLPEDTGKRSETGCFLLNNTPVSPTKTKFSILDGIVIDNFRVKLAQSEEELFKQFIDFVTETDPDILVGYEIEMLSWGYLIERGYILNLNLIALLSRIPNFVRNKPEDGVSDLTIPGRIVLDFWRLLRHEIALQSYSFENIVYHVLRERVPLYSFKDITYWWNHPSALYRNKVLKYYFYRVESVLKVAEQLDLIGRTSELAKLFGLQFFEVLSRGSQFRVESMMLRLAKPLNYIPVSPSVQQRATMRAPETLPLIMEPESKFYADPVIVLDFQSLYPSMMIAYNYCFSTSLGRVEHLGQNSPFAFGATQLKVPRRTVKYLHRKDLINISPCGVAFVKKRVREGILPKMLQEILDTRLMVKKSLKRNSGNRTLSRVLDARQLGLKLIANVTYGYTAANFSGRMPCVEVADSVVSKGRETLQRAIDLVEKTRKWRARVVYGDTDSLFVLVAGRSREDAFKIGAEIAEAVTDANPSPVRLKLEKVFHPCVLQTKKRYVGYMYESPEQKQPEYCAKGIETVRRDGCPAVSKMLEKCLKLLFDTRDVSLIRSYVTRQFSKILSGRISIQDLTFAKEYRGSSGYRPGACVPALELARKWTATDKRNEPRRSERVPYVIINGPPGLPLIRLVRSPRELIADPSLRPNALYYITKVIIPPLNRCFLLIGADANNWFNDMPKKQFQYLHTSSPVKGKKSTISQYFSTKNCVICNQQSKDGLCDACMTKTQDTSAILHEKIRILEQHCFETKTICQSCCDSCDKISCVSLDCPVYYKRVQTEKEYHQVPFIRELLLSSLPDLGF